MLTVGSLFAGIGGFDLGLERAGCTPVWQVECDRQATAVLAAHWPAVPRYTDIRTVSGTTLPPVDIITAGWPCQDVSVAGRRAGLAGARTGLFWEIVRIIQEMRDATAGRYPALLVGENVPGHLSSAGGRDWAVVLGALADSGALDLGWRVLDAQYFGVAQRRRRVFLVADYRARRTAAILALPDSRAGHPAAGSTPGASAAGALAGEPEGTSDAAVALVPVLYDPLQVTSAANGSNPRPGGPCHTVPGKGEAPLLTHTLRAEGCDASEDGTGRGIPLVTAVNWQSGGSQPRIGGLREQTDALHASQTLAVHSAAMGIRRLMPVEGERLQGFPDGWTAGRPDASRWRLLGNAVAVPVAHWLGQQIVTQWEGAG